TPQSIFIAIPNSKIWSNTITNYSMRPNRRLDLTIGISYDDDIDTAVALLLELVKKDDRVLPDPEPRVIVKALGESSVDLQIRVWARRQDFWDVHFKLVRDAKYALDEAGISIPYPHRQIVMSEAAPAA
ncbi:MAG: mechanosensitive ion channel family protein, partial [Hyphomicrobiales bacterium]|nr:mechanosensitive ion channel family protein [Hyphomicrobiales bacterium]